MIVLRSIAISAGLNVGRGTSSTGFENALANLVSSKSALGGFDRQCAGAYFKM
jgi:hypothetical protein